MAAVMLDEEKAQEKAGSGYGQHERHRIVEIERKPHHHPKKRKRHGAHRQFERGARVAGLTKGRDMPCHTAHID
jgi:hypothetical protein